MKEILELLPLIQEKTRVANEILLSNLIMISEIPAPTFQEEKRTEFLLWRLSEHNLINCSTDEIGNALAILPGTEGTRNILITAHVDTPFPESVDHTINVLPGTVTGPGVGDNGLGVAALATLPVYLEHLGFQLSSNLILMGSVKSLGKGNIAGMRFFLDHTNYPIHAGICIEGVRLGRLSYSSIGMLRGEIANRVPEEYDWSRFGAGGAIVNINEVINRILEIPIPRRPRTSIIFGSIEGGSSFNVIPTTATLRLEIRSESDEMVERLKEEIQNIAAEVSSQTGTEVEFREYARRRPGGLRFSHPLAENARTILESLGTIPRISPSTSELSAFIDHKIPAVTIGLTHGENLNEVNETIEIEPITQGIAQLIALILAIDRGYCDEAQP
ncbi:M20/M25/M40 family metallo-hydrolase [Spirochaeta thermophila]|nr:M20/M25/M40 family metallo-hydrolase [Spirochaeta thermophila]